MSKDADYYRERAAAERAMAKAASSRKAAEAHDELAKAYEALVEDGQPRPKLGIGSA